MVLYPDVKKTIYNFQSVVTTLTAFCQQTGLHMHRVDQTCGP